jgi:glutamyl-tRNA synthetase
MRDIILKYTLQNAIFYKGKANPGAVVGKVLQELPDAKSDMKALHMQVQAIVKEVNAMSLDQQIAKLTELAPNLLDKKEKKERDIFEFLGIPEGTEVVTAFPPGPEKYPHIGHAKASLINYLLAKRYGGKFILRFEDTNPSLVKNEFYEIIQENLAWLGVVWDELVYASDHMSTFHNHALALLEKGDAYMCSCNPESIRENRAKGRPCGCRSKSQAANVADWHRFPSLKEGEMTLRLKIDMEHKNSTMRDPSVFRIVDAEHARHGTKYKVWPTYDFQNAVMDGVSGVTHRLRSKEFELRNELQRHIQKVCGYKETSIYEFARFNLEGVESSGRVIREGIANGSLVGWDDPSLTTLVALRRRGFLPEAIRNFVVGTGISKAESTLTWDDLIIQNKRLLDAKCERYFFVQDPVEITINGGSVHDIHLKKHPEEPGFGLREYRVHEKFFITPKDMESLKTGKLYRFMDCCNFKKSGNSFEFDSLEYEKYKDHGERIMHYLPKIDGLVETEIMMPDKTVVKGLSEPLVSELETGTVIQFERFGFCRLDRIEGDKRVFWYTHN